MLHSLKKPTASGAKKTLTPAERAEALTAAVAAAQAAQAAKKTANPSGGSAKTTSTSATASKTNGKDSKGSKEKKDTKEEGDSKEDGENGTDDKDDDEEEKEDEKGQSAEAKAAMKNMTGYQQETEREGVDSDKLEKAMSLITDVVKKQKADKAASQKEIEKLTLSKADVELIMTEMDLPKALAEKHLKEHGGDVTRTLEALVSA
ncbi:hypothetical protein BGX27_010989 [Mortierella sp. AM989]|nr:hypothetical protein BGX27_010989 [Mortierella sp. AM989]